MIRKKNILSISKYNRVAPKKIEKILNNIKKKSYIQVLTLLKQLKQKAGKIVYKVLYSAVANATQKLELSCEKEKLKNKLIIEEAFVTRGHILKRIQPRAKGKSYKIEKIFSHITIKLKEI